MVSGKQFDMVTLVSGEVVCVVDVLDGDAIGWFNVEFFGDEPHVEAVNRIEIEE